MSSSLRSLTSILSESEVPSRFAIDADALSRFLASLSSLTRWPSVPSPLLILSVTDWTLASDLSSLSRLCLTPWMLSFNSPSFCEPTTWPMVRRISRASAVASRVLRRIATTSPDSPEVRSCRSPEKPWKLVSTASSLAPLESMVRSIPFVMRCRLAMIERMLFSPASLPRTLRRFPVTSWMSPAIFDSELKMSFIEGWRRTLRSSSPSASSGSRALPGVTSRRKSPRMLSDRLVMVASRWSRKLFCTRM